jgi:hypothetical protein
MDATNPQLVQNTIIVKGNKAKNNIMRYACTNMINKLKQFTQCRFVELKNLHEYYEYLYRLFRYLEL